MGPLNRSLLLAILAFMLLIPISPHIAACAAHFGALETLLIAVFSAFCNLSISPPFMSITSAPLQSAWYHHSFPICFLHHYTRWQLFSMTKFVITLNLLLFFSPSFRSFILQTHFFLLLLSLRSILVLPLLLYY